MDLVASAAVVAVVIAAAILFRDQVVRLMPASRARPMRGLVCRRPARLVIEQVKAETDFQGGRPALSVTGQLRNVRDVATEAPPLRVSLLDRAGKTVAAARWPGRSTRRCRPTRCAISPSPSSIRRPRRMT